MALSFEESKKQLAQQVAAATPMMAAMPMVASPENSGVMTLDESDGMIAAYSTWTKSNKYIWNDQYSDDRISSIDKNKNITVADSQINITQEENSQYIPFEMPRYYDGFDLMGTTLSIHYVTSDGYHGESEPINVSYDSSTIKFGWLVDGFVTHIAGDVKFEIRAIGVNANGKAYVWKSKTFDKMHVLQSLIDDRTIELDDTWVQELVTRVAENVAEKVAEAQVEDQRLAAEAAAQRAETAANNAQATVNNSLKNYYTKSEVDTAVANVKVDLTGYATETYVQEKIDAIPEVDLTDYALKTDIPSVDGFATETYVQEEIAKVDVTEQLAGYALKSEIPSIEGLATETYVDQAIAGVDVSDQLGNLGVDEEGNTLTVTQYVDKKVAEVDVSDQLTDYAKSADVYTKTEVDTKTDPLSSSIETNRTNIASLSETVGELQNAINSVDTSPRLTYDVKYNDTEDADVGENVFAFYEITNEGAENEVREIKQKFTITGGGGGGTTSSSLKIGYITTSPLVVTINDRAIIKFSFSGTDSSGDVVTEGNATWKVAGTVVATGTVIAGENEFDITDYLAIGTQKVNLTVVDDAGSLVSKNWTVQKIDVRLESTFNDKLTYPIGPVSFDYTPYGAVSKNIHFILDGGQLGVISTNTSGIPTAYELPSQEHGAHLLEVYMKTEVNGNPIESNHIIKDIIWYDPDSSVPVIGCTQQNFVARQYDATNIVYTVYDPNTTTPKVVLKSVYMNDDGEEIDEFESELTLMSNTNVWQYKTDVVGVHILTITCGETTKTLIARIEELDINITPVTAGLAFDFNPAGKSNNDADRLWTYNTGSNKVSMVVSPNFDWVNGGYQMDENGDQYFCVKSGTFATIDYKLFDDDAKTNGKEFKVVFKTTNIKNRDTTFLSCMDNNIGVDMKVENTRIYSSNNNLYSPYCEEDIIEFEFNINKSTDIPMVITYEDGVGNRPMIYTSDASFWQTTPQPITIGSDDCDVHIYRMKAYTRSLSDSDILANFIADARNADEMISRYNRNQIYNENGLLTPEVLAEKCPDLRIIMIDAPWFTNDKDNKVEDTIVRMIYKNGDRILDNWTCTGAKHSGQGTSSNEYGYAGRNIDLIMDGDSSLFTLGDGTTSKTITLTRDSVPTDYLNVKVNIASSENQNNAQMARRYNMYNPFVRSAKFNDSKVKDCMEFYNCVIFIKERNTDISTHREFQDTNYHFYAIGNVGDSKKTDDTRVNDKNDPKEHVVEITDYNVPLAEFPTGNGDNICSPADWKTGNTAYDYLYAEYKYKEGKFKSFGAESYEFRYEMKGITEEQREVNINSWRDMYKFVVTSTDAEFYSRLKEYFVIDSALYYYLFTERYTMVDNRAKNSFWHYGKVYITEAEAVTLGDKAGGFIVDNEQAAINGGYRYDLSWGYDFDTSLGIDNTGKLVLTYGKEDSDYYVDGDPSSAYIYRAAKSNFFCRLRDLFKSELQGMFVNREDVNAWSASGLIAQWDNAQNEFPEELWRLDIQRKYLRTYKGISVDNSIAGEANPRFLTEMMNGRKKYQRRMFERNQELYMATKYFGKTATQDQIMMRFNNPEMYILKPNFTLYITPYSDMYIGVKFGNVEAVNFRAKAGIEYTIPYSIAADTADITLIYGASFIQAIGDLSKCYVGDNDFSKASRLQRLVIGSNIRGYANTYMKKISMGNNKLLEYLDIRQVTGLTDVVDLSQCGNLLELHAEGSGATGVIFANGGKVQKFYIPAVTSLTMKNLNYIQEFTIEGYNNLQSLVVENTPAIDTYEMIGLSPNLRILRLIGLYWENKDTDILDRIYLMRGINNDGGEIPTSVLTGYVSLGNIRDHQLREYQTIWPDLEISAGNVIIQHPVTFINYDGTILQIQYIDHGQSAIDPVSTGQIPTPVRPSTVSTDYTYAGWDTTLDKIFSPRTITAVYTGETRTYTIKYVSKGIILQESTGLYGEYIDYEGETPTYTMEEIGYKFYLFNRWDKSGYVDCDKTINAIFDECAYTEHYYDGKELADLTNVEIYMLSKVGVENTTMVLEDGDPYSIRLGHDIEFDDVESQLIVADKTELNGENDYIDTGIPLFAQDREFTLAIDYKFLDGNVKNSVLAQCYRNNGSAGFKLWFNANNNLKFTWGSNTSSTAPAVMNTREMLVLRHKSGDNKIYVYKSNLTYNEISMETMETTKDTVFDNTLILGCGKADDGIPEGFAKGNIYWCKVWYKDLGDNMCQKLANWTHENIDFQMCGQKRFYLSNEPNKRCAFSLLATHLLDRARKFNTDSSDRGGWATSSLNQFLNTRLYEAMPMQTRLLLKLVSVPSATSKWEIINGTNTPSKEIVYSDCYITIPAAIELDASSTYSQDPYNSEMDITKGKTISYMINDAARKRMYVEGLYAYYWTRSPSTYTYSSSSCYMVVVDSGGYVYRYSGYLTNQYGVLIEISF